MTTSPATPPADSARTLPLVVLTAMLVGANYTAVKEALDFTSPLILTAMRTVVGGTFLLIFVLLRGERLPRRLDQLGSIFLVSLAITTVSSMTLVAGVSYVTAGVGALLSATMPLFMAVLAVVFLGERPGRLGIGGLVLGFVGAAVLASPALSGRTELRGVLLLLVATSSWAVGGILLKRLPALAEVSPLVVVAIQLPMSAVVVSAVALLVEGFGQTTWDRGLLLPVAYSSIPAMAVSFSLFATVLRRAPAIQGASIAYLTPLFGVLVGWLIRSESLSAVELVGGFLVLIGVGCVATDGARTSGQK